MPRSRANELPQRPSPRAPHSLRTSSSSDSDPVRSRTTERSPRLSDGRSPREPPLNQRKLGSRIADLETQLGQAQGELKSLKDQLASAEAAKKAAQELLDKKSRKPKKVVEIQEKKQSSEEFYDDVFEVPVEKAAVESKEAPAMPAPVVLSSCDEMASKNGDITLLEGKLDEKSKEVEALREENAKMKAQLDEKSRKMSSAEAKVEELTLRLKQADEEVEKGKAREASINEKLEAAERGKAELESEMKMLRVQTEQWKKAADAAAMVLAGEVEMNGRRISERCGSMDKQLYGNPFEPVGVGRYTGSPGLADDSNDVYGGGKRKGSGIKMLGDLWRKRGNK